MRALPLLLLLLIAPLAAAQESTSYKLNEHVLNSGGNPDGGVVLSSANFRITLDAVGESVVKRGMSSASYNLDAGFGYRYRPPGEVTALRFTNQATLVWDQEASVGWYNLYRDLMSHLSGLGYGDCEQYDLTSATTTDTDSVPADDGYFYLVTAENSLSEEGTKGYDSDYWERPNSAPCP